MPAKKILCLLALALTQLASPAVARDEVCRAFENGRLSDDILTFSEVVAGAVCAADQNACRWTFPYRSRDANAAAESLHLAIMKCHSLVSVTKDAPVNHPDSYHAQIYLFPNISVVLSIKDKATLAATFVTLRAAPQN